MNLKQEQVEFDEIIRVLKRVLKSKRISYKDLAQKVNLSESGLKKVFYGGDCSYRRLSQIAAALEIKVIDILHEVEKSNPSQARFSKEQQTFFLKHRQSFDFFVRLVIERSPIEVIQSELALTKSQTFSILRKLDKNKLIKLLPDGKIKLPPLRQVESFGEGPLLETVYQEWSGQFIKSHANPSRQKSGDFIIRGFSLRPDSFQELKERLLSIEKEFLQRAIREMKMLSRDLKPIRWISLIDQNSITKTYTDPV